MSRSCRLRYNPFFPPTISLGRITQQLGVGIENVLKVHNRKLTPLKFVGNGDNPNSQSQMFFDDSADVAVVSFGNTPLADEPWWPLFTTWPFMPDPLTFVFWVLQGGGIELCNELLLERNLIAIPCAGFSCAASGWSNLQITDPAQFQGLRTRAFGYYGDILERLGATNRIINGQELIQAIEDGDIDFAEFATPDMDVQLGLDQVTEFMYVPGWHENVEIFYLVWNTCSWNKLCPRARTGIKNLCTATLLDSITALAGDDAEVLRLLASENRIIRWNDNLLSTFQREWNSILQDIFTTSSTFADVYRSIVRSETRLTLRDEVLCIDITSRPPQRPNGTEVAAFTTTNTSDESFVTWIIGIANRQINIDGINWYNNIIALTVANDAVAGVMEAAADAGITNLTRSQGVIVNISTVPGALVNTLNDAVSANVLNPQDIVSMLQTERGETVISFPTQELAQTFASWVSLRPSGVRAPPRTDGFPLVTTQSLNVEEPYISYYDQFTQAGLNMDIFQSTLTSRNVGVPSALREQFEPLVDNIVEVLVIILDPVPGALLAFLEFLEFVPTVIINTERGETTISPN